MPRPHIALLDASIGDTHVQRNFKRELEAAFTIFRTSAGEIPQPIIPEDEDAPANGEPANDEPAAEDIVSPYDAVIVSGSQLSVYHDEPWIDELSTWVQGAINAGLPVLGVCWGHQLLAQILGGTVEDRGHYELGYVDIEQVQSDPLFEEVPNPFTAFATHSDEVTALPESATIIAQNEAGIQAFRQERVYGVQFHPEYDMRTAEDMIQSKDISMHAIQAALDSVTPENVKAAQATKQLFANFSAFVQEVKAERTQPAGETETGE